MTGSPVDVFLVACTALGFVSILTMVAFLALVARDCVRDHRHLQRRAREAAPALDEAIRLAVVQPQARVYHLSDRRGNGTTAA